MTARPPLVAEVNERAVAGRTVLLFSSTRECYSDVAMSSIYSPAVHHARESVSADEANMGG